MIKFILHAFIYSDIWLGWRRWALWAICIGAVILLGMFRATTDADFSIVSFALFPVLLIAWLGGKRNSVFMAFIAVAAWTMGSILSDRQFSPPWIPWINAAVRFATYSLVAVLAAQVRQQFKREHEYAAQDALTGLLNRAFFNAGDFEVERAKRYVHPLSVVFLDLDNFKQLNDTKGHDAGDEALRATAMAFEKVDKKPQGAGHQAP